MGKDGGGWDRGWQRYGDGGGGCMEPRSDGDVELQEVGYWNVGLCTDVGGSCGVAGGVGVDGTDGVGMAAVLAVVLATVMIQPVLMKVDFLGVVSVLSSGCFVVVMAL